MAADDWLFPQPPIVPKFSLFLDEDRFRRELRRLRLSDWRDAQFGSPNGARVLFLEHNGDHLAIVSVDRKMAKSRPYRVEVYGLLVHEAVHIWQHARDRMKEKNPGGEHEAYTVQHIAQALMHRYDELVAPARRGTRKGP